jgi:O-antigen/teichoic acid export membrane protein
LVRLMILAVNGVLRARGTQRAVVDMLTPGISEKITRIGFGAVVGLVVGFALAVGVVSYYANSVATFVVVVGLSVTTCVILAWIFGERFFQSLHKWLRWF